jgi:hypothetical protein
MLTIEYVDSEETLKIGDLFGLIGFTNLANPTDDSGDSFIKSEWPLEVLSLDGFYQVEGFRWTKPEPMVTLTHRHINPLVLEDRLPTLTCSPDHIIHQQEPAQWTKVKDLKSGDLIVTQDGVRVVVSIDAHDSVERLCDLQVAIAHSYFTDRVLSHNSHFLTMLGANAILSGKNVLHYTLELSENLVGIRYDSFLCDINSNDVIDSKDSIIEKYKSMSGIGRLIIKEFPTNTATIYTLRSHIEKLSVKGFRPDIILIDYADIMRSTRQYDSLRHELKLIYQELRSYAAELGIPVWTASQSNKEGSQSDVIDLGNMSEAYGKAMEADVVLSISRKSHEKATGWGRLYVAKNRAGRDGVVFPIKIDTAKSKFAIVGEQTTPDEASSSDEADVKKALRSKWKELQKDQLFLNKQVSEKDVVQ